MRTFAVLHELEDTQFLVDTDYDHDTNEFKIIYKFWSSKINGYMSATLRWSEENEAGYNAILEKLKSKDYAKFFKDGTEAKF